LANGYISNTGEADIDRLPSRGGMGSMLVTIWLIMTALAFGAVLEHAGMLNRLIEPIVSRVRTIGSLVTAVVASCIGLNLVASDQYIAVVLPARMFRVQFERRGLRRIGRAHYALTSVTTLPRPSRTCTPLYGGHPGVPTPSYAGFTFFCLLNPLASIAIAMLGFHMRVVQKPASASQGSPGDDKEIGP
jgi:NhaC family Na+:H+ antiporter